MTKGHTEHDLSEPELNDVEFLSEDVIHPRNLNKMLRIFWSNFDPACRRSLREGRGWKSHTPYILLWSPCCVAPQHDEGGSGSSQHCHQVGQQSPHFPVRDDLR